jgi:hypothetical protein
MKAMDKALAKKHEALKTGLTQNLPGKDDVAVTLLGHFGGAVKAVASSITGLGTGEINWQNSWVKSF